MMLKIFYLPKTPRSNPAKHDCVITKLYFILRTEHAAPSTRGEKNFQDINSIIQRKKSDD